MQFYILFINIQGFPIVRQSTTVLYQKSVLSVQNVPNICFLKQNTLFQIWIQSSWGVCSKSDFHIIYNILNQVLPMLCKNRSKVDTLYLCQLKMCLHLLAEKRIYIWHTFEILENLFEILLLVYSVKVEFRYLFCRLVYFH